MKMVDYYETSKKTLSKNRRLVLEIIIQNESFSSWFCWSNWSTIAKHLKSSGHTVYEMDIVNDPHWQDLTIKNNVYLLEKVIQCDFVFFLAYDVGIRVSKNISTYLRFYSQQLCDDVRSISRINV